ncbi:GDSL family lipase [Antrihabitans sp. YC3-6]|uniref:GDSL family lipase n=1 Tax=Antrihabitans stalagmiti TaxID=2799499 RepID=A0A934U6S9_9NOCA|nr:GDSL-type esterase/lipase family protein [Antrihabitans stalagmiti]MBJ8342885.1 GDSL family lipase [Antrihabitans stalagmiti]
MRTLRFAVVAVAAATTFLAPTATAAPALCDGNWVGSFSAAPGFVNSTPPQNSTVRAIVVPHLGGETLRLTMTNRFGTQPLTVETTYVGRSVDGTAELVGGTNTPVTFDGRGTVTIPPGADIVSDAVRFDTVAFQPLAVSMYLGQAAATSEHFDAHQMSWLAMGSNAAADVGGQRFTVPYPLLPIVNRVDVEATAGRTIVTFGDSITDGFHNVPMQLGTFGANQRYPDYLARRVAATHPKVGVVSAGISGNQVTRDATPGFETTLGYGPSAVSRFDRDALAVPGVTDVILMEGTNDLASTFHAPSTIEQITAGLAELITRAHARGVRVHLGTIPPRTDVLAPPDAYASITAINNWIRTASEADSVVDFDATLRDPQNPAKLHPQFDSGDGIHPNSAGYQAMADTVDLATVLDGGPGPRCG